MVATIAVEPAARRARAPDLWVALAVLDACDPLARELVETTARAPEDAAPPDAAAVALLGAADEVGTEVGERASDAIEAAVGAARDIDVVPDIHCS